jgi:hypothetical protein
LASILLLLVPMSYAAADGLGPGGYRALAIYFWAVVIGGILLSLAAITGGVWFARRYFSRHAPRTFTEVHRARQQAKETQQQDET